MSDGALTLTLDRMCIYADVHKIQMRTAVAVTNVAFGSTHRKRRIVLQGVLRQMPCLARFPWIRQLFPLRFSLRGKLH